MHFLYIGAFRLPNLDAAAARVLNVSKTLRDTGHMVSFISWGGEQRECDRCSDGKYRIDGFEYVVTNELDPQGGFVSKAKSKLTRGNKTKALLKQKANEIDAIITYNGSLTKWLLKFTKKHGIKLINDITEWYAYSELKCTDRIPYAFNMFVTQKQVKNKIVISSYLDRFYNKSHNIIIPAICDASETKWHTNKEYAEKIVGRFDGVTLIYAGNPSRKDLVHIVINVIQRLVVEGANIRFLILGITREKYIQSYSDLLKTTELSDKIQFLGRVSQDLIPAFYTVSDFMVLLREPSRKSNAGFPTKFAESITSGTPVISNITSDLGNYLKDGITGFIVNKPSEEALYDTLKQKVLITNKDTRGQMQHSVAEMSSTLDYHAFITSLNEFIQNLK